MKPGLVAFLIVLLSATTFVSGAQETLNISADNCTFLQDPEEFQEDTETRRQWISDATASVALMSAMATPNAAFNAAPMPRNNFIDEYIFGRMERDGIAPAPIANDQEFLRRVMLDLTGRLPSPAQVRAFAYDTNPAKRDAIVNALIGNVEFIEKWTMFFGDLFKNNGPSLNVNRYSQGRDTFHYYLLEALTLNKPYNQIAHELIRASGDNFVDGSTNWVVGGRIAMGPAQDTYDGQAVQVADTFLGINTVDCLLCHDGRRHLESVNLWGAGQTRFNMWGLSAFFARTSMRAVVVSQTPRYDKWIVSEAITGEYTLSTTNGNRTARQPQNGATRVGPRYPFNNEVPPPDVDRRLALANIVTNDPQFARAIVNYIWAEFMVEPFVSPVNSFDLARLDPANPPPAPWTLQPTNPELLNALAQWFQRDGFDLRRLMALIVKSNAYQLSSSYPGEWKPHYVPYYARKYARRLKAEEIHDAVSKATGVIPTYTMDYEGSLSPLPPANWAMQFPDTREPRSNRNTGLFLDAFGRGDRDQIPRNSSGSPLQALSMMNNTFVTSRIHTNNEGSLVQRMTRQTPDPLAIIEELYLSTLSRFPYPGEVIVASDTMRRLGNQRGAEALQWALLNKLEFFYSY